MDNCDLEKELEELSNLFLLSYGKNQQMIERQNIQGVERKEALFGYRNSLAESVSSLSLYDNVICNLASLIKEPVLVSEDFLADGVYTNMKIMGPPLFRHRFFKTSEEKISTLLIKIFPEKSEMKGVEFSYRPESAKYKLDKYSFSLTNSLVPRESIYRGNSIDAAANICASFLEEFSLEPDFEYSCLELIPEALRRIPDQFRVYYEKL